MAVSPEDPKINPPVGAVLSQRWRLVRKLGEGGMGLVYAAESLDAAVRVAIKIMRREFVSAADVKSRFLEEGRTCMRLMHPNIVRVVECGQSDDSTPYMVMDLLEGVPLSAYMQRGARIPVARAIPILQGVLGGLGAAHALGIVHRDLKPDNVFLTRDPSGGFVVKVLDFGIAKVMDAAGGMGTKTRTGVLLGTPAYMSPEQARSARDVDPRADLWSAGVLLYEMLTGRTAFPAPTEYARLAAVLSVEPEPLDATDAALAPLAPIVRCALQKNREDRFASSADMSRALAAAIPTPTTRPERLGSDVPAPTLDRLPDAILAPVPERGAAPRGSNDSPGAVPVQANAPEHPANAAGGDRPAPAPGPTGTLASPAAPPLVEGVAPVVVLPAPGLAGALPSVDGSGRHEGSERHGIAPHVVVVLVVTALVAGVLLGWALGHAT
ncbi:MAG: protein kinase [Polyangiaceae bacterium]|jgi:serine/threonine-protein kinase